ncbi:unnamed protein product [Ophioblennius macclurei]
MTSTNFNKRLLDISQELSPDHLDQLKFLVRDQIGKRDHERITSGLILFQILTERGRLAADNIDYLCELLRAIHRHDLSDKLHSNRAKEPEEPREPSELERAKLDAAVLVVAGNLGRSWRKLGRRLGVSEVKLESIAGKHPLDLEETAMELLKEWRRSRGAEAQTKELITALRACQFNLTADKVEDRLSERDFC